MNTSPNPPGGTYWVIPGRLLAGPHPLNMPGFYPEQSIDALISIGINAFVDLTGSNEIPGFSYLPLIQDRSDIPDIRYFNHPIQDFAIPTPAVMRQVLDSIGNLLALGCNPYLHCMGGIGRTGTVVGCYLVEQGFTGEQALAQIMILRQNLGRLWGSSPETDEQREFVLNWKSPNLKLETDKL